MKRPVIFEFDNFQVYLEKAVEFTKWSDKKFSHRQFAKVCGFKSSGTLLGVLNHQRALSEDKLRGLARGLGLNSSETKFFLKLSQLGKCKIEAEKLQIQKELEQERLFFRLVRFNEAQSQYFSDWRIPMIREFISSGANTRELIQARAIWSLESNFLEGALDTLLDLGFIARDGNTFKVESKLVASPLKMNSKELVAYHDELLDLSKKALMDLPQDKRDLRASTLNIDANRFEMLRGEVNKFLCYLVDKYESQATVTDMTVQVNVQSIVLGLDKKLG